MNDTKMDVTAIGSTMIRLSVPKGERLETAPVYEVRTAGTESNTLAALARIGKKVSWCSRLTTNLLGHRIVRDIMSCGVDTSQVIWTEEDRNEVFFLEYAAAPRSIEVIYDRKESAVSHLCYEDLDIDALLNTRIFHATGIFPSLSQKCSDTLMKVMNSARNAGVKISFDVNYRSKLWGTKKASASLKDFLLKTDIVIMTLEDASHLFGINGESMNVASAIYKKFSPEICIITLGGDGAVAFDGSKYYFSKPYSVETVDRIGAGDCFSAGFLCGYLEGDIQHGMDIASAMAALKMGIHGDYFTFSKNEVTAFLDTRQKREVGR